MNKALKITAIVVGAIIAIVLLLAVVASLAAPSFIQGYLASKSGFGVASDKFSINPMGRVEIKNFRITNPASFSSRGFVNIDQITVDVDVPSAATNKVHIRELTVHLGTLELVKRADGITNAKLFADAFKTEEKKGTEPTTTVQKKSEEKDLSIDKLSLSASSIKITDNTYTPARVSTVDLKFNFERTGIQSKAQLQQELMTAVMPVAFRAAGPGMIGELGGTAAAGKGIDAASAGASKAAEKLEKATGKLKNLFNSIK